jgi:hypothetical protein
MLSKGPIKNELAPPPIASANPTAAEVLRIWAAPDAPHELTLRTQWDDPGAWGILLVDLARYVAQAYGQNGVDPARALRRIRELFDAEWESPTSEARDITPGR